MNLKCLFSQRYKIACLKREFAQFYNASQLRKSEAFEESNQCYNKIPLSNIKEDFIETQFSLVIFQGRIAL